MNVEDLNYANPWTYEDKIIGPDHIWVHEYFGFVYRITRIDTGRMYLGRKPFWTRKTRPPLKGKKMKRREMIPSNWMDYWGSNEELLGEIEEFGEDKFKREIVKFAGKPASLSHWKSDAELNYWEAQYIFAENAVLDQKYFNAWCSAKVRQSQLTDLIKEFNK